MEVILKSAQESWEMLLTTFLEPTWDLCWAFCLSHLLLGTFPSFWLGCAISVLVLVGCDCLVVAPCAALLGGSQRDQPNGYLLYYEGFQICKGLKTFWKVVFPNYSLALAFLSAL